MRKAVYSPQSRGARNRSAFGKQQSKGFNVDTNFLLTCSNQMLAAYETKCLGTISNLRADLQEIFDQLGEAIGQAMLVRWFRNTDRDELRMSLDTPVDPVAWAKEQIRRQGRSDEEVEEQLSEILSLNPGLAHRTAAVTYQKRNLAEGKCISCPKPLDRNSTTYCTKHLRDARVRHKPIGSAAPGSADFLYADADQLQSRHGRQLGTLANLTMQREQKTRALLAELGIPPESAAVSLKAAKEALMKCMPDSEASAMTAAQLFDKAVVPTGQTGQKALRELLAAGAIQRIGKGGTGSPFWYFATPTEETRKPKHPAKGKVQQNTLLLQTLRGEEPK